MLTAFILDDDANLLVALDILFSRNGYKVYTFKSSDELLLALNTSTPDIILLDILLSETMDGKTLCKELKQQEHFPNKIYLFSATHILDEELLQSGADGFIDKPFDIKVLLDTLHKSD
jgi:DNA-binding response OmpR family regulator